MAELCVRSVPCIVRQHFEVGDQGAVPVRVSHILNLAKGIIRILPAGIVGQWVVALHSLAGDIAVEGDIESVGGVVGVEAGVEEERHPLQAARVGMDGALGEAVSEVDEGGVDDDGGQQESEETGVGQRQCGGAREGAHWADLIGDHRW